MVERVRLKPKEKPKYLGKSVDHEREERLKKRIKELFEAGRTDEHGMPEFLCRRLWE